MERAALGTRHGKLPAIAPQLEPLGIEVVPVELDTDRFGTFSGTIPRTGTQLETATAKARASAAAAGLELGLASEGAFGPDPVIGLVAVGIELVVLHDPRRRRVVVGRDATHDTNYAHATVRDLAEARTFIARAGRNGHGHGLLAHADDHVIELQDEEDDVRRLLLDHPLLRLETDMRAHRNPTRMRAIERAAHDLARNLRQPCPSCERTGVADLEPRAGLPCECCRRPTGRVAWIDARCSWCEAPFTLPPRHGLEFANPGECAGCNP
ncbi:MAG: hypothetical protein KDC46_03435 [Thermoleophilia bacterium]|nr:hypothetical protein [Thermoleophilia bacterium]